MSSDLTQYELTEEELRELIPQLQQLTDKYKRAERVQKALFDISELMVLSALKILTFYR